MTVSRTAELEKLFSQAPLADEYVLDRLEGVHRLFEEKSARFMGYQANQAIDYTPLSRFLRFSPNNVGDPYIDSNYGVNTRLIEREVIAFFARLYNIEGQDYWGYVTSGGTEANLYGLYVGRNYLETLLQNKAEGFPIAYFSGDSHYSVAKAMDLLRIRFESIPSDTLGRIRVEALLDRIEQNDPQKHPPLILVNAGTTFTGAYDDIAGVVEGLKRRGVERHYIHVDAALGGLFLPFVERIEGMSERVPRFDFRLPVGSISTSGHKALGAPFPCGVFITYNSMLSYGSKRQVEYIGSLDTTLAGSRSGLAPLVMWYGIAQLGIDGFVAQARQMLDAADYAVQVFREIGLSPWKSDLGLSVIFERPPEWVVQKWSLSTQGEQAHIYTMQHMTRERIDGLAKDLRAVREVLKRSTSEVGDKAADRVHFLRSVELFSFMGPEDLLRVANISNERVFDEGTFLCHQGDPGDELYIVIKGEVEVIDERSGEGPTVRYLARSGSAVGEFSVLTNRPRTAALRCRTSALLLTLRGTDFRTLMHEHAEISHRIIDTLVEKILAT